MSGVRAPGHHTGGEVATVGKERPLKEREYGRKGQKEGATDLKRAIAQGIKYCWGR
jgi:hypothetical protein